MSDPILQHPVFGPLTWSAKDEMWLGAVNVAGHSAVLQLIPEKTGAAPEELVTIYRLLVAKLEGLLPDVVRWIGKDLAHWLEEVEDTRPKTLQSQLKITLVDIYAPDGATVMVEGLEVFENSGHYIEGRFGANAQLDYYCLCG